LKIEPAVTTLTCNGTGWIPDVRDPRDYTHRHEAIRSPLNQLKPMENEELPDEVDLRTGSRPGQSYFSEADEPGSLNASTSFAVLNLVDYFERCVNGRPLDSSKLFLYKVTRNLRNEGSLSFGDTGADLRTTFKALRSYGVPPAEQWPYEIDRFDEEPSPLAFRLAQPMSHLKYFRLDAPGQDYLVTWYTLKSFLAAGFPVAFGFSVSTLFSMMSKYQYQSYLDGSRSGQAAVAIGYRNDHFGRGRHALLIHNPWAGQLGNSGNGWLPVDLIKNEMARDFWTLMSEQWTATTELCLPTAVKYSINLVD
jgi:C1A family cysteine protease